MSVRVGGSMVAIGILLVVPTMAQERVPEILQIFREPLKPGSELAYEAVETETARLCVELKCPHPHVAIEPLSGPKEIWWLNAFASEAEQRQVEKAYAANRPLMAALERNSKRKAVYTGEPVNVFVHYRPDLSRGAPWSLKGARFLVVAITREPLAAEGLVFEAPDDERYFLKPVASLERAEAVSAQLGSTARVFAVRSKWGLPAQEWIDADPEFWKTNPAFGRR